MLAPIPIRLSSIRSSPTASSRRWRMPARSAAAPAGRRATSCSRMRQAIVGCAPCYLKSHSQGEYVFDHAWADAYERAGGRYYPKLQIAVPFTPVPGGACWCARARCRGRRGAAGRRPPSSSSSAAALWAARHVPSEGEWDGWASGASSSAPTSSSTGATPAMPPSMISWARSPRASARRSARSERSARNGITIERLTGRDITEAHWDAFFAFYMERARASGGGPISTASRSR